MSFSYGSDNNNSYESFTQINKVQIFVRLYYRDLFTYLKKSDATTGKYFSLLKTKLSDYLFFLVLSMIFTRDGRDLLRNKISRDLNCET